MEINDLLNAVTELVRDNTSWAIAISLAIAALVYWNPKGMLKLMLAALTLGAIIYVLAFLVDLTSQGIDASREFSKTPKIEVD